MTTQSFGVHDPGSPPFCDCMECSHYFASNPGERERLEAAFADFFSAADKFVQHANQTGKRGE